MLKERFCVPNLPKSRVRRVFVSQLLPQEIFNGLREMLVIPYILGKSNNLNNELAYHPDILVNNFKRGAWLCENNAQYIPANFPRKLISESETELGELYPFDCPFNNFRINRTLVCGMSADYLITAYAQYDNCEIIRVPQNYTKCCCIPINEQAIITSDYYIGRTLRKNGFDVLTIDDSEDIYLNGFSHGLIGGCAGMISNDTLAFTGNINKYKYGNEIRDFCENHGVYVFSLTSKPMYDYGGILPITEIADNDTEDVSYVFNNNNAE